MIDLDGPVFRDKVYGCWLGKNCGGTLGAPLERAWGEPELFDVWWYPELQAGGIPNDDLEMQLIWLKALEEIGPQLKAADLAQYWLDHIGYNWDEYGLSKTNLRLGLQPPVSGAYNNWFKDMMGCPIRSEIWACIAPGMPAVAARFAYEDAICDHAGGESVYGELFNVTIESAAFVIADREQLLDIGLSYVPPNSRTARAVRAARDAYAQGMDWKQARAHVLRATPHHVAQYSPINMGFQVIGWLYGDDFGDALCKTVNCGYDTDCTGATIGSILGIIAGGRALPRKWTEPLGESISTNEAWGGIKHASTGPNPVPVSLEELTDRVIAVAHKVRTALPLDSREAAPSSPVAGAEIKQLWNRSPMRVEFALPSLHVGVDYVDTPAAIPGTARTIITHLTNPHPAPVAAACRLTLPDGWSDAPAAQQVEVPAGDERRVEWSIRLPAAAQVANTNRLLLSVEPHERPAQPAVPIVLIGAHKYRVSELYPLEGRTDRALFDAELDPERSVGPLIEPAARAGVWREVYALDNALPATGALDAGGALYLQTFLWAPAERDVLLAAMATTPAKMWVNGEPRVASYRYRPLRPNYGADAESAASVHLRQGWNEVLIKLVRAADARAAECHLMISSDDRLHDGQPDIGRTRLPWDG